MNEIEYKTCTGCSEPKPLADFHRNAYGDHLGRCRACRAAIRKVWRKTYRDKQVTYRRRFQLSRYGLTEGEYDSMLVAQGGVCAMCSGVCTSGRQLAVDHDHDSGRVRGLLCRQCNQWLGVFEAIKAAAEAYLSEHGGGNPHISHGDALARERAAPRTRQSIGTAQLTDDDVRLMRRRYAMEDVTQRSLAREFGISQNAVSLILRRKTWQHVEDEGCPPAADLSTRHIDRFVERVRRLTDDQIAEARRLHATGASYRTIASQLGVHHTTIMRLLTGKHWKAA